MNHPVVYYFFHILPLPKDQVIKMDYITNLVDEIIIDSELDPQEIITELMHRIKNKSVDDLFLNKFNEEKTNEEKLENNIGMTI